MRGAIPPLANTFSQRGAQLSIGTPFTLTLPHYVTVSIVLLLPLSYIKISPQHSVLTHPECDRPHFTTT